MVFKLFSEENVRNVVIEDISVISISKESASSNRIGFFSAIKSLGKINAFDSSLPPSFALTIPREIKYYWEFNKSPLVGLTAERTVGAFMTSTGDEHYNSSSNDSSTATHQALYNYSKGYLYRNDNNYDASVTALNSSSTAQTIDSLKIITIRRDLFKSSVAPNSFRLEVNISNTSSTGVVTGVASAYTTAMDLKNPIAQNLKSFFVVPWNQKSVTSIDTCTTAITIEAIIRPYKSNAVILWRRLSSSAYRGSEIVTQNAFMKLELTKSPDEKSNAFRFYIRSATADGDFNEDFSKKDVQASGLFVPSDVGINLFDGRFHHLIATWSTSGLSSASIEGGAGSVFGYIDGYKLANREQTDPRLGGADVANGPTIQANMFQQSYPIKTTAIEHGDPLDGPGSGNNLYIGISNFNHYDTNVEGDRGAASSTSSPYLGGGFDGQIQHVRMWNWRFSDGTTGVIQDVNKLVTATSTAGISFSNFSAATLTSNVSLTSHMVGWWNFNELNTLTATDVATGRSNTGNLYGEASIKLYDHEDISKKLSVVDGDSDSGTNKTYLYFDIKENNFINNDMSQGRIVRKAADGKIKRVGLIYYDLGLITFDSDDDTARLNYLYPASGSTGDFGFSVTGSNNAAINIERMVFNSIDNIGRLVLDAVAEGNEYNYSENSTSVTNTGESVLDIPATYITTVGLYNDEGDMLAIAKLSNPVRKDEASKIITSVVMNF